MNKTPRYDYDWTHFHVEDDSGRITGFALGTCENCGGPVQDANSIGLRETPTRLLSLGFIQADTLPPEGYYSNKTRGEACDECNG